ncbi:APC family permease [Caproiciproducens galactitolivorans]|uniref:APC family permease n=1 Tax=Caproiciproducens galactitolivorans TaxID=642589 RepID=A0ABT4BU33_9FIRM|nr:APC family permease [Caproiciproducens galactitolivorans]MCY1713588.1 APC family permease [Caproiciproducens galactitolivorans]
MSNHSAEKIPAENNGSNGMKKTLSLWNYFTIGFGAIIGTGWVLLVGDWMIIGGGPTAAIIAFAVGAVFLLPIGAVFGELTAAIPISGGIVEYVDRTYGSKVSYYTGWLLALGNGILCPWEAIAISTLVSEKFGDFFPVLRSVKLYTILGADVYLFPTLISLCFAVYVIRLNFKGASSAAKLQAFLTKALLAGMVLAMGISLFKGGPQNIQPLFSKVTGPASSTEATGLFAGIVSVLVMTPFFYAGFDTIPQQAEEAAEGLDWHKFGRIISLALLASGGFYIICIYSFGSIIPWTEFVKSSVPALACLKNINIVLYVVMLCIATMGPMGPMNSFYGATTRIMLAMGRKGQLPETFSRLDPKKGTPITANILMSVLTLAGPFLGKKMLVPLTNVSALAFIFSCTMVSFACLKMRRTEPNLNRPYKVPGGKIGIGAACAAGSIIIGLLVVPASPAALKPVEWVIVFGWLAIGLLLSILSGKKKARA